MTLLAGLTTPEPAPLSVEEYRNMDISTKLLIEAGVYDQSWPEAKAAFLESAFEYGLKYVTYAITAGVKFKVH